MSLGRWLYYTNKYVVVLSMSIRSAQQDRYMGLAPASDPCRVHAFHSTKLVEAIQTSGRIAIKDDPHTVPYYEGGQAAHPWLDKDGIRASA